MNEPDDKLRRFLNCMGADESCRFSVQAREGVSLIEFEEFVTRNTPIVDHCTESDEPKGPVVKY